MGKKSEKWANNSLQKKNKILSKKMKNNILENNNG
jgi:hypothetical protein